MKAKKSLQKLTETDKKLNAILALDVISPADLQPLSKAESVQLMNILTDKLNQFKGEDRDKFCQKIDPIIDKSTKNQLWESNHIQITWAISILMQEYGRMPTKSEIATKTELSRQTIHKHLKEYANHPQFIGQMEQFRFMTSKVLTRVFHFAVNGDTQAAKLYFNVMGVLNSSQPNNTLVQNQNNYIQINSTVLSQETLKHLNTEQLNSIETILKTALSATVLNDTK